MTPSASPSPTAPTPRRAVRSDTSNVCAEGGSYFQVCRAMRRRLPPRERVGGLCDIEAPIADLAALQLAPTISLVVENLNTGIALPDIDGTVAFMRLGLAVDQLEGIGWRSKSMQPFCCAPGLAKPANLLRCESALGVCAPLSCSSPVCRSRPRSHGWPFRVTARDRRA